MGLQMLGSLEPELGSTKHAENAIDEKNLP